MFMKTLRLYGSFTLATSLARSGIYEQGLHIFLKETREPSPPGGARRPVTRTRADCGSPWGPREPERGRLVPQPLTQGPRRPRRREPGPQGLTRTTWGLPSWGSYPHSLDVRVVFILKQRPMPDLGVLVAPRGRGGRLL